MVQSQPMKATRRRRTSSRGTPTLWGERPCRYQISGRARALNMAMCRGLRTSWDVDEAAQRVVDLGLAHRTIEQACDDAHRLHLHDPTTATARAELTLARAIEIATQREERR